MIDDRDPPRSAGRPPITDCATGTALRRWYWRKDELVAHARALGLKTTGGKFEILDRIAHFLDTGEREAPGARRAQPLSKFDWHSADLSRRTVITDNYKNTQNVRRFFKAELGEGFKFNIAFMDWMKANAGRTLADAVEAYRAIQREQSRSGAKTQIRDHNQFNQYTRDFLADNPALGLDDVRRVWALKINTPSETGRHRYHPSDLRLGEED